MQTAKVDTKNSKGKQNVMGVAVIKAVYKNNSVP